MTVSKENMPIQKTISQVGRRSLRIAAGVSMGIHLPIKPSLIGKTGVGSYPPSGSYDSPAASGAKMKIKKDVHEAFSLMFDAIWHYCAVAAKHGRPSPDQVVGAAIGIFIEIFRRQGYSQKKIRDLLVDSTNKALAITQELEHKQKSCKK
jgi:hypothetical protein